MRRLAATCVVLAAALAVAGCSESERDQLTSYLEESNDAQRRSAPAFKRADEAYVRFSQGKLPPRRATRPLEAAERSIRSTRAELARIGPPDFAETLKRRLLRIYDRNAALAGETTALARYVPAAAAAQRPLAPVTRRLRSGLRSADGAPGQARVLDRYARALLRVTRRYGRLDPPPLLRAEQHARLRELGAHPQARTAPSHGAAARGRTGSGQAPAPLPPRHRPAATRRASMPARCAATAAGIVISSGPSPPCGARSGACARSSPLRRHENGPAAGAAGPK